MKIPAEVDSSAVISPCGQYRYILERQRRWGHGGDPAALTFCMLNPSTADHTVDDRTIAWCWDYARRRAFHKLVVVNLFAYRATEPAALMRVPDPIGPRNIRTLESVMLESRGPLVCAWGTLPPRLRLHEQTVRRLIRQSGRQVFALRLTKDGFPGHPLYIRKSTELQPWSP